MLQQRLTRHTPSANHITIHISLLILIGLFIYAGSINGEFVWDDNHSTTKNPFVIANTSIFSVFLHKTASDTSLFYRPIQTIMAKLIYRLFTRTDHRIYHIISILLHILATLSLYWLMTLLFNSKPLSFLTSLFFIVHPVHTPAIDFISGSANPLFLFFMLCSFCFYIKINEKKSLPYYALFIITYALSLFSKENALIFPALLLLYHWLFLKKIQWRLFISAPIIIALYVSLRTSLSIFDARSFTTTSPLLQTPGFFKAIATYLRLLILPLGIHIDYGKPLFAWNHPIVLIGICVTLLLIYIAFLYKNKNKLISFSIGLFFLGLAPASNIIFQLPFYMTEHYLYLPSIGFFIITSYLITTLYHSSQTIAKLLTILLLLYFSFFTIQQHHYWKTPDKLYERIISFNPHSTTAYNNYGNYCLLQGQPEKSLNLFQKAAQIRPGPSITQLNLAITYFHLKNYTASYDILQNLLEHPSQSNQNNARVNLIIAHIYIEKKDNEKAIYHLRQAIVLDPYLDKSYFTLSRLYADDQQYDQALDIINKAVTLGLTPEVDNSEYIKHLKKNK